MCDCCNPIQRIVGKMGNMSLWVFVGNFTSNGIVFVAISEDSIIAFRTKNNEDNENGTVASGTKGDKNDVVPGTEDREDDAVPGTENRKDKDTRLIKKYIETKVFIIVVKVLVNVESVVRVVVSKR